MAIFHSHQVICIRCPHYGALRRNVAVIFRMDKLEWWGYQKIKNVWGHIFSFPYNTRTCGLAGTAPWHFGVGPPRKFGMAPHMLVCRRKRMIDWYKATRCGGGRNRRRNAIHHLWSAIVLIANELTEVVRRLVMLMDTVPCCYVIASLAQPLIISGTRVLTLQLFRAHVYSWKLAFYCLIEF